VSFVRFFRAPLNPKINVTLYKEEIEVADLNLTKPFITRWTLFRGWNIEFV
jgi:hypothetical protein